MPCYRPNNFVPAPPPNPENPFSGIDSNLQGIQVTIVTTNPTCPTIIGQLINLGVNSPLIACRLTDCYCGIPAGTTIYINPDEIIAIS